MPRKNKQRKYKQRRKRTQEGMNLERALLLKYIRATLMNTSKQK